CAGADWGFFYGLDSW
nr:immunoglobulin heavy chain junction region [Macaca mulatta]MOV89674.1 immunoglobulin heavy chain junction region [Macaca mulatta]MOV89907.1 immunoglobulin heavy chain junction region [Macaca mulatta]